MKLKSYTEIKPYPKNPKAHPEEQLLGLANIVKEVGWRMPCVINADKEIIAGHGRLAMYEKYKDDYGLKPIWVMCNGVTVYGAPENTPMTPEQEKIYRIADNKLAESEWIVSNLLSEIEGIDNVELTGFSFDELQDYQIVAEKPNIARRKLTEKFIVPPFSILDSRSGYWLERKRAWHVIIGDKAESREKTLSKGNSILNEINTGASLLDPVLAELCLTWFNIKGGKTFDCFAGDSVFGFVSNYKGYPFTGIELRKEQVDINNSRLGEKSKSRYICDDGQNVAKHIKPKTQDMLFSCPPYFDLEVYSELKNDASNQSTYKDFLAILEKALSDSISCLKDNRFATIVIGDVRNKKGHYRNLPTDIKRIFFKNKMVLYNELVFVESLGTLPQRVSRSMRLRKIGKCHQYLLVFFKGNVANIKNDFEVIEYGSENLEL